MDAGPHVRRREVHPRLRLAVLTGDDRVRVSAGNTRKESGYETVAARRSVRAAARDGRLRLTEGSGEADRHGSAAAADHGHHGDAGGDDEQEPNDHLGIQVGR
jgi:hypothetical protein